MSLKNALIVDDTDANRLFFERLMTQASFTVIGARSGAEAVSAMMTLPSLAVALVDLEIGDMSGLELLMRLRMKHPDCCLIVATMHDDRSVMESAFNKGCDIFLVKPNGFIDLFKRLSAAPADQLRPEEPLIIDQYGVRQYVAAKA
jgi:CheY-like chemotaxis protein